MAPPAPRGPLQYRPASAFPLPFLGPRQAQQSYARFRGQHTPDSMASDNQSVPESPPMKPPKGVPADQLDGLFRAPESEFTGKRNELAKSLREDGESEAAAWVKSLKKPSRAAWLVNQVSARKPKEIGQLLEVGEELRKAQEEMLAGAPDREKLRD